MQLLTFTIGSELYAIESRRVVEVLPLVPARRIPRTPDCVRGVFTCRGRLVPMVDLAVRLVGLPVRELLGTRVIVVDCPVAAGADGRGSFWLGLAAENVLGVREVSVAEPTPADADARSGLQDGHLDRALGRLVRIDGLIVQVVAVEYVLEPAFAAELAHVETRAASAAPPLPERAAAPP